jgi:hypothetical protein
MTETGPQARLSEELRYRRALVIGRLLVVGFAALVLALLVAVVFLALQVRHTQLDGTPTGKKLLESSEQIISCTTPGKKCAEANQRAMASAIKAISHNNAKAAAAATACAARRPHQSFAKVYACTLAALQPADR